MTQIFVITASNLAARKNVELTLAHPIELNIVAAHFPREILDDLKSDQDGEGIYAWGALPGEGNKRNWERMQSGDYILLYQNGAYTFASRVILKAQNDSFARAVWGTDEEGKTWELMYFLEQPTRVKLPAINLIDFLPGQYMGFSRISDDRIERILAEYSSVDTFIKERLMVDVPGPYLMIRLNTESKWRDEEGKSYHYATTVANYRQVVQGAEVLIERRFPECKRVIARAKVSRVQEEPEHGESGRQLRATFQFYKPLRPPRVLVPDLEQAIAALPGYNVQHSIKVLTKELFERLAQPAAAWIFRADPNTYDIRGASQKKLRELTWRIIQHQEDIQPGNRVYLWESGPTSGIVGIAEVTEGATRQPDLSDEFVKNPTTTAEEILRAKIRILGPADPVLEDYQLKKHPILQNLSIFAQAQDTNFPVTPEQAEILESLLFPDDGREDANVNAQPKVVPSEYERVAAKIVEEGFFFPDDLVKNYLISLRTKPFVILTGLSGNGKTALTRIVAEALNERYRAIAVRPNWTDARDLFGFYNPITKEYVTPPALRFILDAAAEYQQKGAKAKRFHLCLDEMNLSRVEYYFADVLSAM
jgi:hypothetical protein